MWSAASGRFHDMICGCLLQQIQTARLKELGRTLAYSRTPGVKLYSPQVWLTDIGGPRSDFSSYPFGDAGFRAGGVALVAKLADGE
tara:strand:+ start:1033 stop:1290 length:258 start_codon:yes stop_codon:yes gene_type:complete